MNQAIIFAAPSGSGKTSIVKELLKIYPHLTFSVSATTRFKRANEVDGKDYHFLSLDQFNQKIKSQDFIEYQEVYPNLFYGTLKSELQKIWDSNGIVIFDVDVIGGINLKKIFGDSALSVFIKAPNLEILKQRLVSRGTESQESLQMRLDKARAELEYQKFYDYVLINNDLESALVEIKSQIENFIQF